MPPPPSNTEVINKVSTGLFHSPEAKANGWLNRGLSFLQFALFLSMSLWESLTLKDWLFSIASPYPYLAAAGISSAVTAGYAALLLIRHPGRWLGVVLTIGLLWQTAFKGGWQFLGVALGAAVLSFRLGSFPTQSSTSSLSRWKFARCAGLAFLFAVGLFLIWRGLGISETLSVSVTHSSNAFWLGQGIGTTGENDAIPFSLRLMQEQGLLFVVTLIVTMVCAFACGIFVLARSQDFPDRQLRTVLCAIALGTLYGVLSMAPDGLPFEAINSVPGTWLLALSVASLGIAAAPKLQPKQRVLDTRSVNSSRNRMTSQFWLSLFITLMIAVASVEYSLHHQVINRTQAQVIAPLYAVPGPMRDATVAMEDGHFYQHHGFDWIAMHRALRADLRDGRVEQGGSTITQQLAKNLFLTNDRTVVRKLEEAAYTAELEHNLSKQRILELYLNKIDYGCGQHGITAAAAYYFHETPAKLTLAQSALLVGLVPAPPQTPDELNLNDLAQGQQTALSRVAFFFPGRYSSAELTASSVASLDHSVYPFKDAWDRGATDTIPAVWHGVSFFFYADPDDPGSIDHVSASLKPALAAFLEDAKQKYGLTGINHLGVYNDRTMRQSQTAVSAHAFGQAIDISGFRFRNGSQVQVADHTDSKVAARLAPIKALLKQHFPIVVDWRDDPLRHQTHFHCEVRGPRPGSSTVQPLGSAGMAAFGANIPTTRSQQVDRFRLWQQGDLVRQTTPSSCGPASLATVLTYYLGRPTTDDEMIDLSHSRGGGTGPEDLEKACNATGYDATFSAMTMAQMLHRIQVTNIPVVALWSQPEGHWVVVVGQHSDGKLMVSNPNAGNQSMTISQFSRLWVGGGTLSIMPPD